MSLQAGVLIVLLAAAHAEPVRSPVRSAIAPSSVSLPLPEIVRALDDDGKRRALVGLDGLDRSLLDTEALGELSEAYRLLGRNHEALEAAQSLSSRDSSSPKGDIQSILALAQSGNFASAQAAAESGLKRFPGDKNLLALLYEVKGRGAPTAAAPPAIDGAQPRATDQAGRQSIRFTERPMRSRVEIPRLSDGALPIEEDARFGNETAGWTRKQIDRAEKWAVGGIDWALGLESEERSTALNGARKGAVVVGAIGGTAGTVFGSVACSPAFPTGAPYFGCVAASGGGALAASAVLGAYVTGGVAVLYERGRTWYHENGFGPAKESPTSE